MPFPTSFPQSAVNELGKAVVTKEFNTDQLTLAAYELLGYALFTYFGDVKYYVQADGEVLAKVRKLLDKVPVGQLLADFAILKASGVPVWLIVIKLAAKYGER